MHTADLDYLQQADDKLESPEGKILVHCGSRKEKDFHSKVDRKDTAGSNMEEQVVDNKMEEEEEIGSKMEEEAVGRQVTDLKELQHLYPSVH